MHSKRATFNSWCVVGVTCVVAWFVGGEWIALGRTDSGANVAAADGPEGAWQPPVMVENPFVMPQTNSDNSATQQVPDDPTLPIPGAPADVDLPPIYRLPPVTPHGLPNEVPIKLPMDAPLADERTIEIEMPSADFSDEPKRPPAPQLARATRQFVSEPAPHASRPESGLFTPTSTELTNQLLPAVQRGCDLAQRGALYAAKTEFIQVIRRIAQVNDAERGTDTHSRALAEGLRALEEAADFVPSGAGLEGELDVTVAASSHRTPIVRQSPQAVAPHTAVALYHGFAQERLAIAVGGQQAGSMALYGLGKVHARLAEQSDNDVLATRSAMTMYLAALAASPANHLAANELGVLLCRSGHAFEATQVFEQAIDCAPSATTYHNLAIAQQRIGLFAQSTANQQEAARLAAWERSTGAVSRRAGVAWVAPEQFAQVAGPMTGGASPMNTVPPGLPAAQNAPIPMPYTAAPAAPKSPFEKAIAAAKSISLPGSNGTDKSTNAAPAPRPATSGSAARTRNIPWY